MKRAKKRVLVVDDDPGIGKVLGIGLRLYGYDVVSTTSGAEAIELVHTQNPAVVLLDIVMPGVTGLEVLERLRGFSKVPIVIFTGHPSVIRIASKIGADDYIAKPIDPELLVEKIRLCLRSHRIKKGHDGDQRKNPPR